MIRTGDSTNGRKFSEGSGSPESVLTGSIGDVYSDIAGGAGTTFYVKESGNATNTGWIAVGTEDHKLFVTATDALAGYLLNKVVAANGMSLTSLDQGGGNQGLQIGVNDLELGAANAVYEGAPGTDGSWRMVRSGTDLVFERRESGSWIEKGAITAA